MATLPVGTDARAPAPFRAGFTVQKILVIEAPARLAYLTAKFVQIQRHVQLALVVLLLLTILV